jgi:hypothetical protein
MAHSPDPIKEQVESAQEPVIPPGALLALAGVAFLVGIFVTLTQPEPGAVGIGGFAFGALALLLWVVLAPEQARALLTGRAARFGGTSVLITMLLLVALVAVYVVVRNLNARLDLTQRSDFSLTPESRQAIAALGIDPSLPAVEIAVFYGTSQAGQRDQDEPLLRDYADTSGGKVRYRFIDPDRQPGLVQRYGVTAQGQVVVAALDTATGEPDLANAERVSFISQQALTNAILKVSAQGQFRALIIPVIDGTHEQMTTFRRILTQQLDWTVEQVTLAQLASPEGAIRLNDPNIDGEIMILPGGSRALSEAELNVIRTYLDGGGSLLIMAGTNLNSDQTSLATADNLSAYLEENFGLRFNKDVIIDPTQSLQNPLSPVAVDFDTSAYISSSGIRAGTSIAVFDLASSIAISPAPPPNVVVTPLVRTGPSSYAKTDLSAILAGNGARAEGDAAGPFVVMAQAENAQTGARVILASSTALADDELTLFGQIANLSLAINSAIWATDFEDYFQGITIVQQQRPQDQPIAATQGTVATVNAIVLGLPFAVLLLGVFVWYNSRERAR